LQLLKRALPALLVMLFLFTANLSGAQSRLAQLAAANPADPDVLNSYGIELANSGDLMGAIGVWRRALDFDRSNVHLYNNIGSALKRLGQDQHAFAWYAAALQLQPVYWTYYNIALLYRDHNQPAEACWALGEALRLNPQFAEATNLLQRIRAGEAGREQKVKAETATVKKPVAGPEPTELPGPEKKKLRETVVTSRPETTKPASAGSNIARKTKPQVDEEPLSLPSGSGGQVFLTFDGGATDAGFDSILSSLRRFGVKSTFFLTGKFAQNYPDKCRQLLVEGHEIGNHSMNHPDMKNFSAEKIAAEIEAAEQAFEKVLGRRGAPFFRFPYGHQNKRVEQIVENLGYRPVYWHIDTIDWREDPVETIISRVKNKLRRNSVILMHLGSKNGAKALDRILQHVIARGYAPVRLSDLDASQLVSLP